MSQRPNDPVWDRRYKELLSSPAWRKRRRELIIKADFRCVRCKRQTPDFAAFEINHRTYERLGRELDADLEVVCKGCHPDADRERAIRSKARARRALEDARFDGFVRKLEERGEYMTPEAAQDTYDDWLEKKRDRGGW